MALCAERSDGMEVKMEKSIINQKRKLGFTLGVLLIVINVSALLFSLAIEKWGILEIGSNVWVELIINAFFTYVVGYSSIMFLLRKVEKIEPRPKVKLGAKKMWFYIFVTLGTGYFMSMLTNVVITLIQGALNINIADRVTTLVQKSNPIALVIFIATLGPICEELMFRGYLLKKLRVYGDKTAIIYTAIAFGLFHANVSQIAFATVIGLILAYITVKTNNIKYSIILHIVVNSISTIMNILLQYNLYGIVALMSILIMILVVTAIIVLPIKASKCKIEINNEGKYDKLKLYKNIGYIFSVIVVVIVTVLGSIIFKV